MSVHLETYLKELVEERDRLSSPMASLSDNTAKSYADSWKRFESWCAKASRIALPADDDTLTLWVTSMLVDGRKTATVRIRVSGVMHHLAEAGCPVRREHINALVNAARRRRSEQERQMRALTAEQLWMMSRVADAGTARGLRDRAILVLGFAGGFRRSEISALDLADLTFVPKGILIRLRRSKTDQFGEGRDVGVFKGERADTCPVRTLKAWLARRGDSPGPVFYAMNGQDTITGRRMPAEGIADVIKYAVRRIGLDPHQYAGHSLRSGFVTTAGENGATEMAIMARTGHKRSATVHRYMRPVSAFTTNPLAGKI